jgi:hypothetical protein
MTGSTPRRIIDPAKVQTRGVLAGCYRGSRASLLQCLTHSVEEGADKTLCRRIKEENLADEYGGDASAPPTCPECLRRDPRFSAERNRSNEESKPKSPLKLRRESVLAGSLCAYIHDASGYSIEPNVPYMATKNPRAEGYVIRAADKRVVGESDTLHGAKVKLGMLLKKSGSSNALVPHKSTHTDLPLDMDDYVPHGAGPLSSALLRAIHAGRPITKIAGYKVYAVDGAAVRNLVHIDFTTGGNPGRYSYVPEGEVWVERVLEPSDAAASLLHELVETILMQEGGLDYDKAHEEASNVETMLRAQMQWSPGDKSTLSPLQAADVAANWLSRWLRVRRAG